MEAGRRVDASLASSNKVIRALEYYIDNAKAAYWRYVEREFDWMIGPARHELALHGTAHHLWQVWLGFIAFGPWVESPTHEAMQQMIAAHAAGLTEGSYRDLLLECDEQGRLAEVDRSLLEATRALSQASAAWRSGYIRLGMPESTVDQLDELILLQDEFSRLRDVYQQVFESVCRTLWLAALISNLSRNGDPRDFSGLHYLDAQGTSRPVGSIRAFRKLPNAFKVATVQCSSNFGELFDGLDNRLRNAIGHASARHNLREGVITNNEGEKLRYFDFVARVYGLTLPLSAAVVLARNARVLAAEVRASRSSTVE